MDKLVFIDANIFLEIFLKDEKSEICKNFINRIINQNIKVKTSDFILYACLLQIHKKVKSIELMNEFIEFIHQLRLKDIIEIIRPELKEMHTAIKILEKYKLDFDDSLIVSCMINNNISTLISLDKDFDKVNIIKRKAP